MDSKILPYKSDWKNQTGKNWRLPKMMFLGIVGAVAIILSIVEIPTILKGAGRYYVNHVSDI